MKNSINLKIILGAILFVGSTLVFNLSVTACGQYVQDSTTKRLVAADVSEVFNTLKYFLPSEYRDISIRILSNNEPNAWVEYTIIAPRIVPSARVTITTAMLNSLDSQSELAGIIGHEMGHFVLGHLDGAGEADNRLNEFAADTFSVYLMERAGYDVCQIKNVWRTFLTKFGDDLQTYSHPSTVQRLFYMTFKRCGG